MKTLKEMEDGVNTLIHYSCIGLIIILILCILIYALQILIGYFTIISLGG